MNWGTVVGWCGALLSFGAAVGYGFAHDWQKSLYFFFACCITVVVWK